MNPAIRTENLGKHFGRTAALDGVSLAVPEGAIYALVGRNGAGKTTLIKLLMNILRPSAGSARVLDADATRLAGKGFRGIGYVSENQELPNWMTVGALLDFCRPFYPHWDREFAERLVEQFDLPLKRQLRQLSRGMRMKAAFVSALAYRPRLIVLDEPFSGLDPLVRDELIDSLLELAGESTIFLSSHDLAEIESLASHVGYLEEGHLLFSEEMSTLSARFRDVTVTLPEAVSARADSPAAPGIPSVWIDVQVSGPVIRFVHTQFEGEAAERQVAEAFPAALSIVYDPMPLRAIFLAVAKSQRNLSRLAKANASARTVKP
jgi:ABC-2 type transport system ATP-binding protein